jgi:hypothetical protein
VPDKPHGAPVFLRRSCYSRQVQPLEDSTLQSARLESPFSCDEPRWDQLLDGRSFSSIELHIPLDRTDYANLSIQG